MQLSEVHTYSPQNHAFFPLIDPALPHIHESTDYLAFVTRTQEVILHNQKTGRSAVIHRAQHPVQYLQFTHQHLIVVEQSVHELLVFSLRNEKLKKRVSGHRSQVTGVAYCRQSGLIASISHDQCLIHVESTLAKEKTLKCSTSSFIACGFSLSGNHLATTFKDGSVFLWNLGDYSHLDAALAQRQLKTTLNHNSILAVYNTKSILLADTSREVLLFQELPIFWQGSILQVSFLQGMLIICTDQCFYLSEIRQDHKYLIGEVKQIRNSINCFAVAEYQSVLLLVADKLRKFSLVRVGRGKLNIGKILDSPLTNEGLVCAGGYGQQQGCIISNAIFTRNQYGAVTQQLEPINSTNYAPINTSFSVEKLKQFARKHHALPQKHRPLAYKFLLQLPLSPHDFRALQRQGRHQCSQLLQARYPLGGGKVSQAMKDMLSLLAHYHPVFAESQYVPAIIFPFVCLFGNDQFLCFEILYRLFTRTLAFLFEDFPVANSRYLQNMFEILSNQDKQLINHLKSKQISFTKLAWGLLSSLFTVNFNRQNFLALVDNIFVRTDQPEHIMFVCLGYLIYNRARILTIQSQAQMNSYFQQEHTVHIGKFLAVIDRLGDKHRKNVYYSFNIIGFGGSRYEPLSNVPKDTLLMYENKRKVLTQQLQKKQEEQVYRDKMLLEMEKMIVKARRDAERQMLQKQSYALHCQNESNSRLHFQPKDHSLRIQKIEKLMEELTKALQNQKNKKQILKNHMPAYTNLQVQSNEELEALELKLMNLLTSIKPNSFNHPLKSQPFAIHKPAVSQQKAFKSAINSQLTNQLWDIDTLAHANQAKRWQNNIISSMKA